MEKKRWKIGTVGGIGRDGREERGRWAMKVGGFSRRGEMEKLPRCKNMRIASPTSTLDKTRTQRERYARSCSEACGEEIARPSTFTKDDAVALCKRMEKEEDEEEEEEEEEEDAQVEGEGGRTESSGQLSKPPSTRALTPVPPPRGLAPSANNKKYTIRWPPHESNGPAHRRDRSRPNYTSRLPLSDRIST